jgi:predicted lactoylglutathione lyase
MLKIEDFKPFVPSNDYEVSKEFYKCIGFTVNWDSEEVCEIDTNFISRFLLLPRNHNNYGQSLMLHFMVNSAQEWYDHFLSIGLMEKFEGTKVAAPELMPWGLLITHVSDPAGVLLHFAERPDENTSPPSKRI